MCHSVALLFLYGALDSPPFVPSHVASGRCFLSAAAAGAPAGVVSVFAEPRRWCAGGCAGCGGMCRLRVSGAQYLAYWGMCWLLPGSFDCFCCPRTSVHLPPTVPLARHKGGLLRENPPSAAPPSPTCGPTAITHAGPRRQLPGSRRAAASCRPLRPVLLLVSFPRSQSPVVGVLGLCWMWRDVPFARQRRSIVGVPGLCWWHPPPHTHTPSSGAEGLKGALGRGGGGGSKLHDQQAPPFPNAPGAP